MLGSGIDVEATPSRGRHRGHSGKALGGDPDHSVGESRMLTFSLSSQGRLLAVIHTERRHIIRFKGFARRARRLGLAPEVQLTK